MLVLGSAPPLGVLEAVALAGELEDLTAVGEPIEGGEAKLFGSALVAMSDAILQAAEDEESCFNGARVFDRMSRSQQLASLEVVARHLFHETPACLPLTAWSEATLASVLHEAKRLVEEEVEEGEKSEYRQMVLDTLDHDEEVDNWDDPEEWEGLLGCYEDRFLWDLDYEDEEATDLSPELSRQNRAVMGIGEDYYAAIPPDLRADESLQRSAERLLATVSGRRS
ncbi:hypothetical protein [Botrimarina hoheduenensis]|uniref:Uncharacterized protein n=1 Tax=Botrimarina hoheduenensis TaxID=2528000 RepID=A0A5C5WDH9_9BACT|nr:hypothetical protein [Botrimarina hoheduenensis]TWT48958.1 hypothetical protein Pla111_07360 [Botrimarina hoheduenensis]